MSNFPAVMPHHDLVPIFDDAWYLKGSVNMKPLVRLQRNMVVLRHDGELTLINSIRLNPEGEAALQALGKVAHVVRIGVHGMDDAYYVDRFKAKLWGLPGVQQAHGLTATELTADSLPHPGLSLFVFELTKNPECALLLNAGGERSAEESARPRGGTTTAVGRPVSVRAWGSVQPQGASGAAAGWGLAACGCDALGLS